jgi:hypothetical protein
MNPQGWFQSVTWLPKPISTQSLTGFPNTHNNPSTHLSSTHLAPPKRMDLHPSLPCSPSRIPSPYFGIQHNWSKILIMELSILTVVNNVEHGPRISDMQASSDGWITPATTTSNNTVTNLREFGSLSQFKMQVRMDP